MEEVRLQADAPRVDGAVVVFSSRKLENLERVVEKAIQGLRYEDGIKQIQNAA